MKDYWAFVKTKTFLKHFALAMLSLFVFLFLCFQLLGVITDHGETIPVPDFKGKKLTELEAFIADKEMAYKIIDTLYMPEEAPGIVIRQDPAPGVAVKYGRTIYLYVTSQMPPQIEMPQFADRSLRQALSMIESYGLKKGSVRYESGDEGAVLRQVVDGKEYTAEDIKSAKESGRPVMIKKGTIVSLVVGQSGNSIQVPYNNVVGSSLQEALSRLNAFSCQVIYEGSVADSSALRVIRQYPDPSLVNQLGESAEVKLTVSDKEDVMELNSEQKP